MKFLPFTSISPSTIPHTAPSWWLLLLLYVSTMIMMIMCTLSTKND